MAEINLDVWLASERKARLMTIDLAERQADDGEFAERAICRLRKANLVK